MEDCTKRCLELDGIIEEEVNKRVSAVETAQWNQAATEVEAVKTVVAWNNLAKKVQRISPGSVCVIGRLFHVVHGNEVEIDLNRVVKLVSKKSMFSGDASCLRRFRMDEDVDDCSKIACVVFHRVYMGKLQLLVRWEDSLLQECSWVFAEQVTGSGSCMRYVDGIDDPGNRLHKVLQGKSNVLCRMVKAMYTRKCDGRLICA
jgi:hypothetical protein